MCYDLNSVISKSTHLSIYLQTFGTGMCLVICELGIIVRFACFWQTGRYLGTGGYLSLMGVIKSVGVYDSIATVRSFC